MAASPILMPKLGLTMTEGLIAEWRVGAGDHVQAGDVLFVVETDKIATEVEARGAGRIEEIEVPVGDTVPVGAVVATWTGPALGEDVSEFEPPSSGEGDRPQDGGGGAPLRAAPSDVPSAAATSPRGGGFGRRIVATPYARRLAREAGLALADVEGSGPGGRIKAADVSARLARPAPALPAAVIPFTAMVEVDVTALEGLRDRIAAEAGEELPLGRFLTRAFELATTGEEPGVRFTDLSAGTAAWLLSALDDGEVAHLAVGAPRAEFRPDAEGAPLARRVVTLTIAGDPARLSAERGIALLETLAGLLGNPLKLLL